MNLKNNTLFDVLEKHNQEALTAITFGQELTDAASGVEILSFVKILLKRFEHCQQFRSVIDPKVKVNSTLYRIHKIT